MSTLVPGAWRWHGKRRMTLPAPPIPDPYLPGSPAYPIRTCQRVTEHPDGMTRVDCGGPALVQLTQAGVGSVDTSVREMPGVAQVPLQVSVDGRATFRVLTRAGVGAEWLPVVEAASSSLLQYIEWAPFVRLEVTTGIGTVNLGIG